MDTILWLVWLLAGSTVGLGIWVSVLVGILSADQGFYNDLQKDYDELNQRHLDLEKKLKSIKELVG